MGVRFSESFRAKGGTVNQPDRHAIDTSKEIATDYHELGA